MQRMFLYAGWEYLRFGQKGALQHIRIHKQTFLAAPKPGELSLRQEKPHTLQGANEGPDGEHGQEEVEPKSNNLELLLTTGSEIQNIKA